MEITKREIVTSISIIALMFLFGTILSQKISESIMDSNEKYNKAIKIENKELFEYGMRTNIGNAFVYGELKVIDIVTYPEIGGEYSYVKKVKEEYTRHTRTVTYTDSKGKTKTRTETYWTWDEIDRETLKSEKVIFLGVEFDYSKFSRLDDYYITTIKESSDIRYKYYGSPTSATGTIFTTLKDNDIGEDITLYKDMDISETYEYLKEGVATLVLFWFMWILIIVGLVYGFYYLDNNWLNS